MLFSVATISAEGSIPAASTQLYPIVFQCFIKTKATGNRTFRQVSIIGCGCCKGTWYRNTALQSVAA
jgi:hypothetical protein